MTGRAKATTRAQENHRENACKCGKASIFPVLFPIPLPAADTIASRIGKKEMDLRITLLLLHLVCRGDPEMSMNVCMFILINLDKDQATTDSQK